MRRRTLALAASLLVLPCLGLPADARANRYSVDACPRSPIPNEAGWISDKFQIAAGTIGSYERCVTAREFGINLDNAPQPDGASSSWTFEAPEGTAIAAVRWDRTVTARAPYVYELVRSRHDVLESSFPGRGLQTAPPNGVMERKYLEIDDTSFTIRVRCEAGAGMSCAHRDDNGVSFHSPQVELDDYAPPSVGVILTPGAPAERPESWLLSVLATDLGSGTRSMAVLLDGEPLATGAPVAPSTGCVQGLITTVRPCPGYSLAQVSLPRATVVDGRAVLSVIATDAAGGTNNWGPKPISSLVHVMRDAAIAPTDSSTPAAASPLSISASLPVHNSGRPGTYAKPPVLSGTVRGGDGAPMPRTTLQLSTRPLVRGAAFTDLRTLTTDAKGEFSTRLPAGPSREIKLTAARTGGWAVATLQAIVKAPIRVKANRARTRNGRTVRFIGTIPGAPADARTRVDLQAWAGRWVPFGSATVRRGRFSAKYTFKRTYRPTTYRFRAVLRADPDFPYAPATSKQVRVRVIP